MSRLGLAAPAGAGRDGFGRLNEGFDVADGGRVGFAVTIGVEGADVGEGSSPVDGVAGDGSVGGEGGALDAADRRDLFRATLRAPSGDCGRHHD